MSVSSNSFNTRMSGAGTVTLSMSITKWHRPWRSASVFSSACDFIQSTRTLGELILSAERDHDPLSVFLFDLDHFKHYNDANGHLAGDALLRDLTRLVKQHIRRDDVFGRFGGEEFVLALPHTAQSQALAVADKVRAVIAAHPFPYASAQPLGRVSVSGGVAEFPVDGKDSAALLRDSRVWFDRVRPGLLLYGIVPPPLASTIPLAPVMRLDSRIVAVKGMRPGEITGYGARFRADRPTSVAIVPAGYADGLDLRLAGRGSVLIRGRRAPIVGSVCMDMLMADVTGMDLSPGDEVVIVGSQGDDRIDVREMAAAIGTIPWEVVCRVGSRIERHYH